MWDKVGVVAGVISAICAVISLGYLVAPHKPEPSSDQGERIVSLNALFSFLLASSGWILAVLSFLWAFQPYGPYLTKADYLQVVGISLGVPALIFFLSGVRHLQRERGKTD